MNLNRHDLDKLGELVYSIDSKTYIKVFKDKNLAIESLKERLIVENEKNNDNNHYYYVLLENKNDKDVKGLMVLADERQNFLKSVISILKDFKFKIAIKFIYIEFLDYFVLSKYKKDELYLAELAVSSDSQNKGYGTILINEAIKIAKEKGFKKLILDAHTSNTNAIRFYKSKGFQIFNKKEEKVFNKDRTMYNMKYVL
jgi:ribosomal protein S18 acetylase RimI-like enzyme